MLLLKFYGLNMGLFFSSCLDMLFNDYFVSCGVTTHSAVTVKEISQDTICPIFAGKFHLDSFFLQSTIFISSLFYSYLQLISNVQCLGVSLLMCWFVVSCSCPPYPIFLVCWEKKHSKRQLKRVTLPFLALFFNPDSSPLSGCSMYSMSPLCGSQVLQARRDVHTHDLKLYNSVLDSLCHIKNVFVDHKQLMCL